MHNLYLKKLLKKHILKAQYVFWGHLYYNKYMKKCAKQDSAIGWEHLLVERGEITYD